MRQEGKVESYLWKKCEYLSMGLLGILSYLCVCLCHKASIILHCNHDIAYISVFRNRYFVTQHISKWPQIMFQKTTIKSKKSESGWLCKYRRITYRYHNEKHIKGVNIMCVCLFGCFKPESGEFAPCKHICTGKWTRVWVFWSFYPQVASLVKIKSSFWYFDKSRDRWVTAIERIIISH